ncbi:hypothetical protein HAX54_005668, partial [Datura stramonium]|nr:hypothetical protein [Datura stramonium]
RLDAQTKRRRIEQDRCQANGMSVRKCRHRPIASDEHNKGEKSGNQRLPSRIPIPIHESPSPNSTL